MPPRQRKTNRFREEDADAIVAPIPEDERPVYDDDGIPSAPARTSRPVGQGRRDPALAEAIARGEATETRARRRRPDPAEEEDFEAEGYAALLEEADEGAGDRYGDLADDADGEDDEFPLTHEAKVSIKLSVAFTHRDKNHICIIGVEDGLFPIVDEEGTIVGIESADAAGERIQEYVLDRIDKMIARTEFNIDQRLAAKAAEVRRQRGL